MAGPGTATKLMARGVRVSRGQIMNNILKPKMRKLKVAEVGDFWRKRTCPQIRIQGKWMEKAGIPPNRHVQVENPQPGVLILRLLEKKE